MQDHSPGVLLGMENLMNQSSAENNNIVTENAELIHRTVMAVAADEYVPELEKVLAQAESNGWTSLVGAIRKVLEGVRDLSQITDLDEEDRTIVSAVLRGIEDPSSLPDLTNVLDPAVAGPSMANMIHDAATGNSLAYEAIKTVGKQMIGTNDDFSRIPDILDTMVTGERREDVLCKGLGAAGTSLVQTILEELKKLES